MPDPNEKPEQSGDSNAPKNLDNESHSGPAAQAAGDSVSSESEIQGGSKATPAPTPTPAPVPTPKLPVDVELQDAVKAATVLTAPLHIRQKVVDAFVQEEVDKRAALATKAIVQLKALREAGKKIRPDIESFDGTGKALPGTFTVAKNKERQDNLAEIAKFEKALSDAFDKNEWGTLKNIIK